ncbi:MAG: glycosyltransferase 87 family protein [Acidobacteria bacterium]|nr:glycosyltransferase 87 family protein [Acidobacteriota bacterium]
MTLATPPRVVRGGVLALCGVVLSLCVANWATGAAPPFRVGAHLALYGAAFVAYLVALVASRGLSRRGLLLALGVALVWRAALVVAPPFNDDINRYVWEGRIQQHGGNPFKWSDRPTMERWAPLRDEVWDGMNHRHMPAIYPPLFQLAAWGVTSVHDSVTAMKVFLVLCEIATLGLLAWVLRRRHRPAERLLIMAWSPLALVEVAGAGHNDAFAVMWLVAGLLALELDRPLLSALAVGAGSMAKILPGVVAVAWARRYRPWHVLAALSVIAVCVWPYLDAGRTLFHSLSRFARYWRFNETLFAPLAALLGSHEAAVRAGTVLTLVLALVLAWRRADTTTAAMALVAASLVLSPNVLPWYALWFLPLLVVRDQPAALLFTGTVSLSYLAYPEDQSGDRWSVGWGVRALEYLPCAAVLLLTHLRRGAPESAGNPPARIG